VAMKVTQSVVYDFVVNFLLFPHWICLYEALQLPCRACTSLALKGVLGRKCFGFN